MGRGTGLMLLVAFGAMALPGAAAWEELRRNDSQRLAIDPASIKKRGDEVSFKYLVDFRQKQGDFKTVEYRSLTVRAAIRCKPKTIALRETEVYLGQEAKGPSGGLMKAKRDESRFNKIEQGTSDEELYTRVCAPPKPAAKPEAPKK
jgi:surface-adhesin protein E